jgi:hypothetical protein
MARLAFWGRAVRPKRSKSVESVPLTVSTER